jgi:glycosyltransferase involved in cell wall biosynthesis
MDKPVASVIVPCRNAAGTVEAALAGVQASPLRELEILAVEDGSADNTAEVLARIAAADALVKVFHSGGRGVSAARNLALENASGEFVFFVDADDIVEPELYSKVVDAMRRDCADYCRIAHEENFLRTGDVFKFPLKADYRFTNPDDIREKYLPCYFGYSYVQVRQWYRGVPLTSCREKGVVWAGGFRLDVIRRFNIRFDETIEIFEDAMFLSEYLLACRRTTMVDEVLYHYRLAVTGALITKMSGVQFFNNKLRLLVKREELDVKSGGRLTRLYAASCVFSLLEILRASLRIKGCFFLGLKTFCRYAADPVVKAALRNFPLSWRKPFFSAAVMVVSAASRFMFGKRCR